MRIITRYVLAELVKVFGVSLFGVTLLIILGGVVKEAYSQGLGLRQIVLLIPYLVPEALRYAVPATILFAASSVFGRMSSNNEVVAVKAAGISPMLILWPAFVLATVLSLLSVWINDIAVSWGRQGAMRVVLEAAEEIVYGMLQKNKAYTTRNFSISVQRIDGRKLINANISYQASEDRPRLEITAQEAELRSNPETDTFAFVCRNGTVEYGNGLRVDFPYDPPIIQEIPLADASRKGVGGRRPSDTPLREIPEKVVAQKAKIARLEQTLAAAAAFQMLTGDFATLTSQGQPIVNQLNNERHHYHLLQTEPHRRWANGFSCLCFVMVGAPFAIRLRNADFLTSFFACFLPILLLYYPLLMYGVDRAKAGDLPPYSVWAGNVVLAALGFWILRKVIRY